jgi:hypothetical protein
MTLTSGSIVATIQYDDVVNWNAGSSRCSLHGIATLVRYLTNLARNSQHKRVWLFSSWPCG